MKQAVLQTKEHGNIIIRADRWIDDESKPEKVFFECPRAQNFLEYITEGNFSGSVSSDCYVKGVFLPGEGTFFELYDTFCSSGHEICHLNEQESKERIFDVILWSV